MAVSSLKNQGDGYFTWSLLVALTLDGRVEALQPGKRNKKYRLAG
ncbi:MAG: hypothetical protein ACKVT1_00295 [Dehalococcoidia bacterium]